MWISSMESWSRSCCAMFQCQQWFDSLKPDQDTDSSSAGEASNTDSGRGPSEEGEHSLGSLAPVVGEELCRCPFSQLSALLKTHSFQHVDDGFGSVSFCLYHSLSTHVYQSLEEPLLGTFGGGILIPFPVSFRYDASITMTLKSHQDPSF